MSTDAQELNLPDYYNKEEVTEFIALLDTQLNRFGTKKLRYTSQIILNYLNRVEHHIEEAERLILVVNAIPTHAQRMGFTERKLRTAAYKFYESCSDGLLKEQVKAYGLGDINYFSREGVINALVKKHVELETGNAWGEAAVLAEESGYIGTEQTEKVLKG